MPDLAVEVASPTQKQEGLDTKARGYFAGGTALVWVVWPARRQIDVWHPEDTLQPGAVLGDGDALSGEQVVQGFSLPVAAVFADAPT